MQRLVVYSPPVRAEWIRNIFGRASTHLAYSHLPQSSIPRYSVRTSAYRSASDRLHLHGPDPQYTRLWSSYKGAPEDRAPHRLFLQPLHTAHYRTAVPSHFLRSRAALQIFAELLNRAGSPSCLLPARAFFPIDWKAQFRNNSSGRYLWCHSEFRRPRSQF